MSRSDGRPVEANYEVAGGATRAGPRPARSVTLAVSPLGERVDKPDFSLLGLSGEITILFDERRSPPAAATARHRPADRRRRNQPQEGDPAGPRGVSPGAGPVGLISNPTSGHNRDQFERIHSRVAACPAISHLVTHSMADINPALAELARREVRVLAINGGDGTASHILGEMLETNLPDTPLSCCPAAPPI
jgi:hypothetical protein